jgi:hypothetical protein
MERDVKEVIGALMRVLDGGTISRAEVEDLAFDATGDLQIALDEAFIKLLEFAYDCEKGEKKASVELLSDLQTSLDNVVRAAEPRLRHLKPT